MELVMNTITKSAVCVACMAASAVEASATNEHCAIFDEIVVEGNAKRLPADVARQVTILQSHGDRYSQVIDLILEEYAKPDWAFTVECTAAAVAPSDPTRSVPAGSWFAQFYGVSKPASSGEADDRLALLFDRDRLRNADPALLGQWYTSVISDPMTSDVMHLADVDGIAAVLEGLLESKTVGQFVANLEPDTAQPFFAILFHPALLGVLVEDTDARRANWSSMVDTLEGLYPGDS